MGQKVNPKIFRTGVIYNWNSKWFRKKSFAETLREDILIRKYLYSRLKESGIDRIEIERSANAITIIIYAAKPGIIIGRGGHGVEELKKQIVNRFCKRKIDVSVNIQAIEKPNLSAAVVNQQIIFDIEKRIPYRRAMKQAIDRVKKAGALGVKVLLAGRLDGVEIARTEKLIYGKIPLHTLRADIDYSQGAAHTIYGVVGVKVWIYRGEIFKEDKK